jgi:hypothetical protein
MVLKLGILGHLDSRTLKPEKWAMEHGRLIWNNVWESGMIIHVSSIGMAKLGSADHISVHVFFLILRVQGPKRNNMPSSRIMMHFTIFSKTSQHHTWLDSLKTTRDTKKDYDSQGVEASDVLGLPSGVQIKYVEHYTKSRNFHHTEYFLAAHKGHKKLRLTPFRQK